MENIKSKINAFINAKPYACIGIAFIAGFALGALHHYFAL